MTFSMQGVVQLTPKVIDGNATLADSLALTTNLTHGTGSGQADGYWSGLVTLANGANQTLDLLAGLSVTRLYATGTIGFSAIKHLVIVNRSANVSLTLEPGASNGWSQFGGGKLGKSGVYVIHSPVAGLAIGGTSKTIKITNDGTTTTLTGNTTTGSAAVTGISSTSGLGVGMNVSGTGIPSGAKIASITNGTSLVLSANATATGTAVSLTYGWPDAVVAVYVAGILD